MQASMPQQQQNSWRQSAPHPPLKKHQHLRITSFLLLKDSFHMVTNEQNKTQLVSEKLQGRKLVISCAVQVPTAFPSLRIKLKDSEQKENVQVKLYIIFPRTKLSIFSTSQYFWDHLQKLHAEAIPGKTDLGSDIDGVREA